MAEVVYYVAASVDGYIATVDGGIEWLAAYSARDYGYEKFYASVQAIVMGRQTYAQIEGLGTWPYPGKPVLVFSHRAFRPGSPQTTVTSEAPPDVLAGLEDRGLSRIWLAGGGELAGAFRKEGLITEYIVTLIPVLLGAGIPMFAGPGPQEQLSLAESNPFPDGVLQLRYLRGDAA